jgi:hypothetical protein
VADLEEVKRRKQTVVKKMIPMRNMLILKTQMWRKWLLEPSAVQLSGGHPKHRIGANLLYIYASFVISVDFPCNILT